VLIDKQSLYLEGALDYLMEVLPQEVLRENPQNIPDDGIIPEYMPDVWLFYLLKALRRERWNE